jgi:hypothetical protein
VRHRDILGLLQFSFPFFSKPTKDVRPAKILGIPLGEVFPLFGQIIQRKDRRDRTHWYASAAVDAFDWVNVQHFFLCERSCILLGMNAIYRAGINAGGVFGPDAGFGNNESHKPPHPI